MLAIGPYASGPQAWVASILDRDGVERHGLGILIGPHHVVSCAHVVARALGIADDDVSIPVGTVVIESLQCDARRVARAICWFPVDSSFRRFPQDICLLAVEGPPLAPQCWAERGVQAPHKGRSISVFGFPGGPPGVVSTGGIIVDEVMHGWWQVAPPATRPPSYTAIGQGFSGSLACDAVTGKAVGMVVAKLGDNSYLIPLSVVIEACRLFIPPAGSGNAAQVRVATGLRSDLIERLVGRLLGDRRLMLLAPWQAGLEELGQEIACRASAVTTLCIPAIDDMDPADFYAELACDSAVSSLLDFRRWLKSRIAQEGGSNHVVVLPYFGGPHDRVKELGIGLRGLFETVKGLSLLVLGRHRCAELRSTKDHSLFSGIMIEHDMGLDLAATRALLERLGADPCDAVLVHQAAGGHPDWSALLAAEVRAGRTDGLDQTLADCKLYGVLFDRLMLHEDSRRDEGHAASTLSKLLSNQPVRRLKDIHDDLGYPEVRLYYDGILVEREDRTAFRCEAARLAALRAIKVWRGV